MKKALKFKVNQGVDICLKSVVERVEQSFTKDNYHYMQYFNQDHKSAFFDKFLDIPPSTNLSR